MKFNVFFTFMFQSGWIFVSFFLTLLFSSTSPPSQISGFFCYFTLISLYCPVLFSVSPAVVFRPCHWCVTLCHSSSLCHLSRNLPRYSNTAQAEEDTSVNVRERESEWYLMHKGETVNQGIRCAENQTERDRRGEFLAKLRHCFRPCRTIKSLLMRAQSPWQQIVCVCGHKDKSISLTNGEVTQ